MRVLVATGASGGHIYPALSFLAALESRNKDIHTLLVLPHRGMGNWIVSRSRPVKFLSTIPLRTWPPGEAAVSVFYVLKGVAQSIEILIRFRPDLVVGFGTIDSIALILFAWLFRKKTMIHEQNVSPGKANLFLARVADRIAISFPETGARMGGEPDRIVVTGNPLRPGLRTVDRDQALRFFGFDDGKVTVLVVGGSQGSSRINSFFPAVVARCEDKERLQVIHITGNRDYEALSRQYQGMGIKVKVLGYLNQMEFAYSICDLAVSRAGAMTVAELMYFRIPAILIPYPFAHAHQVSNAKLLEDKGAVVVIKDEELSADRLQQSLQMVMPPARLAQMKACYDAMPFNASASEALVDTALLLAKE